MKRSLKIFCLIMLISNFSFSQNQKINNDGIKYFDENYNPISKTEYEKGKEDNVLLGIQGDSINHKILSIREKQGKVENKKILDSLLNSVTNRKINSRKTIVIIYYPGKDPCNSSSSETKSSIKARYKELEQKIIKITKTKPICIYKDKEGIEKYDGIMTWDKDPDKTIERSFFKYHYPCGSFVVISGKGEFISYFGEYPNEFVWKAAEMLSGK